MIAVIVLVVLAVVASAAAIYDVVHDGPARVRTDWSRVAERCEASRPDSRRVGAAH